MRTSNQLEGRIEELGKASRRAAALSLLGFLIVLAAIGYAFVGLRALERQRASLEKTKQELINDTIQLRRDLTSVREDLANSRASLAAARAAINAFHEGNLEYALTLYDEALETDPQNAFIQNLRAYTLFRLGRIEAAIKGQHNSVTADPNYAWGYFDLARFLYAASPPRIKEAREAEEKAIELRPGIRSIMQADGEFQTVRRHALVGRQKSP